MSNELVAAIIDSNLTPGTKAAQLNFSISMGQATLDEATNALMASTVSGTEYMLALVNPSKLDINTLVAQSIIIKGANRPLSQEIMEILLRNNETTMNFLTGELSTAARQYHNIPRDSRELKTIARFMLKLDEDLAFDPLTNIYFTYPSPELEAIMLSATPLKVFKILDKYLESVFRYADSTVEHTDAIQASLDVLLASVDTRLVPAGDNKTHPEYERSAQKIVDELYLEICPAQFGSFSLLGPFAIYSYIDGAESMFAETKNPRGTLERLIYLFDGIEISLSTLKTREMPFYLDKEIEMVLSASMRMQELQMEKFSTNKIETIIQKMNLLIDQLLREYPFALKRALIKKRNSALLQAFTLWRNLHLGLGDKAETLRKYKEAVKKLKPTERRARSMKQKGCPMGAINC